MGPAPVSGRLDRMMIRPTTVLLDTNVWDELVADRPRGIVKMIRTRQMGRQLEVISCVEVLEEIVGTVDKRQAKFEQLRALHGELINDRLVLQMKERHLCELEHGRILAVRTVRSARRPRSHGCRTR